MFDPSDLSELIRLNGTLDADALRTRGFFFLPVSANEAIEVDLSKQYRDRDTLLEEYWRFHPRYRFLKSVALRARLADIGAGNGGLIRWKHWGSPARSDIFMYAIDMVEGDLFSEYIDFDIVDLNRDQAKYPSETFDAVMCSHLLDFVSDRRRLVHEIARLCRHGAKIYVEWPNSEANDRIGRKALEACGIMAGTVHFSDDPDHLPPLHDRDVRSLFEEVDCASVGSGIISNDYLYPELFRCGVAQRDVDLTTNALWLALSTVRYQIFEKR